MSDQGNSRGVRQGGPRLIAVEFEDPVPDLEPLLDELADKGGPPV